jgi:hypothetical protein
MAIMRGGNAGSGVDRALDNALHADLDDVLESGELYPGERDDACPPYGAYDSDARRWQMPFGTRRVPPATAEPLRTALAQRGKPPADPPQKEPSALPGIPPPPPASAAEREAAVVERLAEIQKGPTLDGEAARQRLDFRFRDELTGIVLIHGVGRQKAGETLLNWTRPIVRAVGDAAQADANLPPGEQRLKPLAHDPRPVSDPVFRASIDFSGETFPVVQVRVAGRTDVPEADPRSRERRWLFTEAWWAAQVTPPSLQDMAVWLGDDGGLGRILQGIQDNMLGHGILGHLGRVSLQAVISVIAAFGFLVFSVVLGLAKLLPFGPLKEFVALQQASDLLTGNFGGARTLLEDPDQSANVRGRLVATIKALRAYGCRQIVVIGHSGGTMVSLQTLTDPAYPRLKIDKLITHGEAINLAWRLETEDQDADRPRLPRGNRMAGDMAVAQPQMLWRDFWATHDPASSGPPVMPEGMTDPGAPRFLAERVYNRMKISEDHNVFWDNDEHFVIPLIREIDAVTTDRTNSAFYSDAAESAIRARRKERVSLLAFWRRATLALPTLAILAALLLTSGGALPDAAKLADAIYPSVPFHTELTDAGRALHDLGAARISGFLPDAFTWAAWHDLGVLVMRLAFLLALTLAVVPSRPDRLWLERPIARAVLLAIDVAIGLGALAAIAIAWLVTGAHGGVGELIGFLGLGAALVGVGWLGRRVRATIRRLEGKAGYADRFLRDLLIVASAVGLALVILVVIALVVSVALVFAGNSAVGSSEATRLTVLGAIVILVGFQLLQRLGIWRWDSWDARERRALRRRPLVYPFRNWVYFLAISLSAIGLVGALVTLAGPAWGPPLLDRNGWLATLGVLTLLVVVLSVGKDVVDSDIDTGEPTAIIPPSPGPAAGSSAS